MADFNYTVKKGDLGLTYLFRDKAKELGYEGDANKVNWQKVMSIFDQIQEEEKAEGETLFSGGNDKTRAGWGKSYVIKTGDVINLTKAQLDKIYTAMGFKKIENAGGSASAGDPNGAAGAGSANGAGDANKPVVTDPTLPQTDPNPPQKHEYDSTFKQAQDLSFLTKESYESYENSGKFAKFIMRNNLQLILDNQNLKELAKVLKYIDEKKPNLTFDEEGNLCSYEIIGVFPDENGGEIRRIKVYNPDGTLNYYYDYIYDADGKNIRDVGRDADGNVTSYTDFEYNENGDIIRSVYRRGVNDSEGELGSVEYYRDYVYDENNKLIQEGLKNPDGSWRYDYYEYGYYEDGRRAAERTLNKNGELVSYEEYEYDGSGNQTTLKYDYDHSGNQTKLKYDANNNLQSVELPEKVTESFTAANEVLNICASLDNPKMTITKEGSTNKASLSLADGRWLWIYYNDDKEVSKIVISYDTTKEKGEAGKADYSEVIYTKDRAWYSYDHTNGMYEGSTKYGYNFDKLAKLAGQILAKIPKEE